MNSVRNTNNGALSYSMRSVDLPRDEEALSRLLKTRAREGFAASAYWGATGEVPPREADNVVSGDTFRFSCEIGRKLVPFPKDCTSLPRALDYTLKGLHLTTNGGALSLQPETMMNPSQLHQLKEGEGDLQDTNDGLRVKPQLLQSVSVAHQPPGHFGDDVMNAIHEGRKKEEALQQHLADLKKKPPRTSEPDGYQLTSEDYCDMSHISPSYYQVMEEDPDCSGESIEVYRSRYNNVERNGPRRREDTFQSIQRGRNVDIDRIRGSLSDKLQKSLPRGYAPHSAKEWMSTTHREHASYDVDRAKEMGDAAAVVPLRNVNYAISEQNQKTLSEQQRRFDQRHNGEFATEYADHYQNRFTEAAIDKKHAGKSVFDINYGVRTIHHYYHHPLSDVITGEIYTPAEVVPGQYTTIAQEPLRARNPLPRTLH